ncbi:28S ribosomal protein S25, mitochondrial [Liparis tanakae]|uniref:Small ribosomal subunit protein mS25 n=1 Tax=Liparis tanakae TaxID=230148 RepID=A0A4Z2FS92_9TELE|nr:28S ribosomal protein S25, mitochondrial [Liparis tanakae]
MPMKGRFPIRRTMEYLQKGDIIFKNRVKIMTVNYNTHGELSDGARKFVFFNIPQIQYKNQWLQIMMFKNMTPSPFLKFYLGEEVLQAEARAKMQASNPANFGPKKYCLRECICEVAGQVPCPSTTPLPKEMTGKYRTKMAAAAE